MSRTAANPNEVTEIRITDAYVYRLVADEQKQTGERSMSRTAARLITERLAIREVKPDQPDAPSASLASA